MDDTPTSYSGELSLIPFAGVASYIARKGATGVVEIDDGQGIHRAFFLNGQPEGARLARLRHPLGRVLVDCQALDEATLAQALERQRASEALLGQVLLEMKAVSEANLDVAFAQQSRLNLLSLFGETSGRFELLEGLVHLTDFTSAPMPAILAIYQGIRDFAPLIVSEPVMARMALWGIALTPRGERILGDLPSKERETLNLLRQPTTTVAVARSSPLAPRSLRALLYAAFTLGGLRLVSPSEL